jgi:N-acyl-D-amino-acid deacylase
VTAASSKTSEASTRLDYIFERASIIDGMGSSRRTADVGIANDRIAAIGDLSTRAASRRIDAHGHVLAPGFIDVHTHDDNALLVDPGMRAKITQGVTTVISGNCGVSLAPLLSDNPPPPLDILSASGDSPFVFSTFASYMAALRAAAPVVNVVPLVGHSTLRVAVMDRVDRAATADEIKAMLTLLEEALTAGARGLSSGLFYPPARKSEPDELVELLACVRRHGGIYTTHMRDEADGIANSLEESFSTARSAGVPLVISHHKCMGERNFGRSIETLALIDEAAARQAVTFDAYPYTAGSSALLPELVRKSARPQISWSKPHPETAGRHLDEIAEDWSISIDAAIARLQPGGAIYPMMSQEDVDRIISHEKCMIGSDGMPHDQRPHPRQWGTFPRVLGHYARDRGLFTIEEAVRRMTGLPAKTFGIADRGEIRIGAFADLVLFDETRIRDCATFDDPARVSEGIQIVMINGRIVLQERRDGEGGSVAEKDTLPFTH